MAKSNITFIEPMLLLRKDKLPEAKSWLYEILCYGLHNISSVAFGVLGRCCFSVADKAHCLLRSTT
jgi:hypothetical protein